MKILLVADVESQYIWDYFQIDRFKDIDLIISCGDVNAEFLSYLVSVIPVPLYYVPGNHNKKYLENPPEGCENIDGKIVVFKGIRIMGLGGSRRYNDGPFQYTEHEMEKRIIKLKFQLWRKKGFDILVSHAPAFGIGDGTDICHIGFKCFLKLFNKYSPKYFFHGHQHLNYGLKIRERDFQNTHIVNGFEYFVIEY